MHKALAAREIVMKTTDNAAYIQRMTKYMICNILSTRVVNKAFTGAREKINGHAVWNVQRALRGYLSRSQGNRTEVLTEAIAKKEDLRLHVAANKVGKRMRGLLIRRRINKLDNTAAKIQGIFRMRW